jgi:uncharacterized membrane protein YqiK
MENPITSIILLLVVVAIVVVVLARFYERATREVSLVRTGVGGRRVVMDGGTVAIPFFHEVSRVNMQTLRLEVRRAGEAALITKDRLRVDIGAEFYVSVISSEEGVARAAQTLGSRTFDAEKLRELIEGKLVDALRSVAARMSMDELHESRGAFVRDVRESLAESLARNGLELDSVSLTALDQTPFKALDENNAFNAVGMRKLAEVIAKSKKERAEIDADADVSVRRAAMEATRRRLQIDLEERQAEIAQVQQIETLKAAQLAEVVKRKADSERESAHARIRMEQDIRTADIAREREVELAESERHISVAQKVQEESRARAAADAARAEAARAAEAIATARQVAEAERRKEIALLAARQEADVAELRAAAKRREMLAEAEGRRAQVDAENAIDSRIAAMKIDLARIDALPKVVAEMVKPAEKIESIRIHQISGLGANQGQPGASKPAVNQALDSIMEMAVQLPALKKIGEDLGLSLEGGLAGVTRGLMPEAGEDPSKAGKGKKS